MGDRPGGALPRARGGGVERPRTRWDLILAAMSHKALPSPSVARAGLQVPTDTSSDHARTIARLTAPRGRESEPRLSREVEMEEWLARVHRLELKQLELELQREERKVRRNADAEREAEAEHEAEVRAAKDELLRSLAARGHLDMVNIDVDALLRQLGESDVKKAPGREPDDSAAEQDEDSAAEPADDAPDDGHDDGVAR
jgi:hypothetical protein